MSTKETGGPAFPCDGMDNGPGNFKGRPSEGMTLRDYFAAAALPSLINKTSTLPTAVLKKYTVSEACALTAYEFADAMLKARQS